MFPASTQEKTPVGRLYRDSQLSQPNQARHAARWRLFGWRLTFSFSGGAGHDLDPIFVRVHRAHWSHDRDCEQKNVIVAGTPRKGVEVRDALLLKVSRPRKWGR